MQTALIRMSYDNCNTGFDLRSFEMIVIGLGLDLFVTARMSLRSDANPLHEFAGGFVAAGLLLICFFYLSRKIKALHSHLHSVTTN